MTAGGPLGGGSVAFGLRAADGPTLRAALRPGQGRGLALILPGRTEFVEKYAEVADRLAERGFAVAAIDWRGQGASARPLADRRKGHVRRFEDYQRDLDALLAAPALAGVPGPRIALAHSMGGAIALRALAEGRLAPAATVFSAPMWGLAYGSATRAVARALAVAATTVGLGGAYAPGGGPTPYALSGPAFNVLTADPEEAARIAAITRAHPDLALGGATLGWARAAFDEIDALAPLRAPGPALVVGGDDDRVVSLAAMRARAADQGWRLLELPGGRHEPLFETPGRRARLWAAVDELLAQTGV